VGFLLVENTTNLAEFTDKLLNVTLGIELATLKLKPTIE
jgi:hypothetical protein